MTDKLQELSYENKRALLMSALDPNNDYRVWIRDIYSDHAVIEEGEGKLFEIPYTIMDGAVTLGERKAVRVAYEAFAELKDVEVLRAGTFTSMSGEAVTYTTADLTEIAKNAGDMEEILKPPLVATHDEGDDASITVFGAVHGGIFHNIRQDGEKLMADIKGMPKKAEELLGEVEEFRLSPEIYKNFSHEGNSYGKALRRVAWVAIPAIKTMAGVTGANLFEEEPDQPSTWVKLHERNQSPTKEEHKMPEDVTKFQEQLDKLSEKIATLTESNAALTTERDALKSDNEAKAIKLSDLATSEKALRIAGMIKPFRAAGLAPVVADRLEKLAETIDASTVAKFGEKEHTPLDEFGEILDSMLNREKEGTLVVEFGEKAPGSEGFAESKVEQETVAAIASASPKKE